jgi:hypothetical protein
MIDIYTSYLLDMNWLLAAGDGVDALGFGGNLRNALKMLAP